MRRAFNEHGFECKITAGSFSVHRDGLIAFFTNHRVSWRHKGQQSLIVSLQIIRNDRMIMTLSTLHIATEEDAADIMSQQVGFRGSIQDKASRRPERRIISVCQQNFPGEHIPRFVVANGFQ